MIAVLFIALCFGACLAQDEKCEGKDDGEVVEYGCRSYTVCIDEIAIIVDCEPDTVFNPELGTCDDPINVGPPCGLFRDCSDKEDGRYRDFFTNCTAYFTCQNSQFLGHNPCAAGLVFDTNPEICLCNYDEVAELCEDNDAFCPLDYPTEPPPNPTTEESVTEAPTTEEPSTEAPPTEEPSTAAPPTEEPSTDAPPTEEPTTDAPPTEEPTTEALPTEEPSTEAPQTDEPSTETPSA